jgi:hypothetical protein
MLCNLALAILEEIAPEFEERVLRWEVVDVSDRQGIERHETLGRICGRKPGRPFHRH